MVNDLCLLMSHNNNYVKSGVVCDVEGESLARDALAGALKVDGGGVPPGTFPHRHRSYV